MDVGVRFCRERGLAGELDVPVFLVEAWCLKGERGDKDLIASPTPRFAFCLRKEKSTHPDAPLILSHPQHRDPGASPPRPNT
jgi:hypothetical protein